MRVLQRFVDNSEKYCFSKIPRVFFGFLPNTSMNEKIHDLLKRFIPYSKPFTVVVRKVIDYLEELGDKCEEYQLETLKIESLFNFVALKKVRFLVCKSVFAKIILQFSKSIAYETRHINENVYEVRTAHSEYIIRKDDQKWDCPCSYQQKTGITCSHLLRVLFLEKSRVMPYIHSQWVLNGRSKQKIQFHRKTRRNQVK